MTRRSSRTWLRVYGTPDLRGLEWASALVGCLSIGVGFAEQAGAGPGLLAALISRGVDEAARIAVAAGAEERTMLGLGGYGDLLASIALDDRPEVVLGNALARGRSLDEAIAEAKLRVEAIALIPRLVAFAKEQDVPAPGLRRAGAHAPGEPGRRRCWRGSSPAERSGARRGESRSGRRPLVAAEAERALAAGRSIELRWSVAVLAQTIRRVAHRVGERASSPRRSCSVFCGSQHCRDATVGRYARNRWRPRRRHTAPGTRLALAADAIGAVAAIASWKPCRVLLGAAVSALRTQTSRRRSICRSWVQLAAASRRTRR